MLAVIFQQNFSNLWASLKVIYKFCSKWYFVTYKLVLGCFLLSFPYRHILQKHSLNAVTSCISHLLALWQDLEMGYATRFYDTFSHMHLDDHFTQEDELEKRKSELIGSARIEAEVKELRKE